jgi:general secretion pathway protein I
MSRARSDLGFSLVETLVALAVFAMAGVALVQLQTHSLETFSRVETRALADIVVQNQLTEIVSSQVRPTNGTREQNIEFAGRTWRATVTIAGTPDPSVRRVTVAVSEGGAAAQSIAHGFFSAPQAATP